MYLGTVLLTVVPTALVTRPPGGRVTNAVGTIFRKIFVGHARALSNNVECVT